MSCSPCSNRSSIVLMSLENSPMAGLLGSNRKDCGNNNRGPVRFRRSEPDSLMRLAHEPELLAHRGGGVADFFDGAAQLVVGDAEMFGPVMHFMGLAERDMAAVVPAVVEEIVGHRLRTLKARKASPRGSRRGFSPPPQTAGMAK